MSKPAFPPPRAPDISPTTPHYYPPNTNPTTSSPYPSTTSNHTRLTTTVTNTPSAPPNIEIKPQNLHPLQTTPSNQANQTTDLLIRIAILETSLSHAKAEKDAISNSLRIIIESLTRLHHYPPTFNSHICHVPNSNAEVGEEEQVKGLEKEIERLRKENKLLRRQVRGQGGKFSWKFGDEEEHEELGAFGAGTPVKKFISAIDKFKSEGRERERVQADFHLKNDIGIQLEAQHFIGSWSNDSQPTANANQSFASNSGSTTEPNTPIVASFADVGLHSLEENMDGFPVAISFNGQGEVKVEEIGGREGDGKLEEQRMAMQKFNNLPKPGVLKVGFEGEGRRGEEYDFRRSKTRDYVRSWGMREYNRFAFPSLPKDASQLSSFFEEHLSKERDLEDSQGFNQPGSSSLWFSPQEREDAIRLHQRMLGPNTKNSVDFFRYGIAYLPCESDNNYFRTVSISNLPSTISLRDVLARVRGGELVSAMLLDTVPLTGVKTALVQFVHESAASEYVSYTRFHPILFSEAKLPAHIALIQTPTWPLSILSRRRIHEHKQTRCLFISHSPPDFDLQYMFRDIAYGNAFRAASLIGVEVDGDGTVWLEFASSNAAGAAFGILTNKATYADLLIGFAVDPCARPLEDLISPAEPKAGLMRVIEPGVDGQLKVECRKCGDEFESTNQQYTHLREVHCIGGIKGFDFESSGGGVGGELVKTRLIALPKRKVKIPSFSGRAIKGANWADEVIEEAESGTVPCLSSPTSLIGSPAQDPTALAKCTGGQNIENAMMETNINEKMFQSPNNWWQDFGLHQALIGLAGSKYARLFSALEDQPAFTRRPHPCPCSKSAFCLLPDSADTSKSISSVSSSASEERNPAFSETNNSSPRSPTRQDVALHRLPMLDKQAPVPMALPFSAVKKDNDNSRFEIRQLTAES